MNRDLTSGSPLKLIILFTIPLLIGNVFQQLYNTADTLIVGRTIGLNALAAVGATTALVFFVIGFAQGLTAGFSIITAQKFGASDKEGVRRSVAASAILCFFINIALTAISVLTVPFLLDAVHTPQDLADNAYKYIVIIFWGTGAAILFNMLSNLMRAIGNSKVPLYFLIIASLVNIILDYLFILNFDMGVSGAAWATVISQIVPSIMCFEYIRRKVPELQARGNDWKVSASELWAHIRLGIPMGFQMSIIAIGIVIVQRALNELGSLAVGAYTVAQRIDVLAVQCILSFGITMATYTAHNYGARKIKRINQGVIQGSLASIIFSILCAILIFFSADFIIKSFIGEKFTSPEEIEETVRLAKLYLKINCPMYFMLSLLIIFRSTLQGLGNSIIPTIAGAIELIMRAAAAILLSGCLGFAGISASNPIAWTGAFIPIIIVYIFLLKTLSKKYSSHQH